jgi:hypothetical protein
MLDVPRPTAAAIIQLFKGALYRDKQAETWRDLLAGQALARAYCAVLGLELIVDEAEGYAFLRQAPDPDEADAAPLPHLIPRYHLSFRLSVLLVLLRKRLLELDAGGGETRLILTRDGLLEELRLFMPQSDNEAKTEDQIGRLLKQATEIGVLRRLEGEPARFEVRRIIKALIDGEWLARLDDKLAEYREHIATPEPVR